MPLRLGKAVVGVKKEGTAYTYDEPAAANAFPAFDIAYTPQGPPFERQETNPTYDKLADVPGVASGEITFKTYMMGSGIAQTAPHWAEAIKACGMKVDVSVADIVTYSPWSTFNDTGGAPDESYSVCVWVDGIKYAIKGAMGNLVLTCQLGQPVELAYTFRGGYVAPEDENIVTPTGVSTEVPPTFLGASFTVHGVSTLRVENFSIDLGNVLAEIRDANDAGGILGYTISDRRIAGTFQVAMELVATHNFLGRWRAGTQGAIAWSVGSAEGNKFAFAAANTQYREPSFGDQESLQTNEQPFSVVVDPGSSDGSSFTITTDDT